MSARRALGAVGLVVAVGLAGCSTATPGRAQPWPQRPVVSLSFDVADDLASVDGHERVAFTPDAPICEMVFRAWPNTPSSASGGASLAVTDAALDGRAVTPRVEAAGAPDGSPGTLITLPLPGCVPAGRTVIAELGFRVGLGRGADDRLGTSPSTSTAWFGSAFPLLSWVRGEGWSRTPAARIAGENTVSEEFRLDDLAITARDDLAVAGTGSATTTAPGPRAGTTTHRFTADAVRDVAVAVGRYEVTDTVVAGVHLHLFTPTTGTRVAPERWCREIGTAIEREVALYGPFPYRDLWTAIAPAQSSGIEYPGALQFGDTTPREVSGLVAHEIAHQWFYALVGNDQGRHPWVDEAFATYTEAVVGDQTDEYDLDAVRDRDRGRLGDPLTAWTRFDDYVDGVYRQGAAALLEGRRRVGPGPFDAAVRRYIDANAHRVAGPGDVAAALAGLPDAIRPLADAGALGPSR